MSANDIQHAKQVGLELNAATDAAPTDELGAALAARTSPNYRWCGMHPFYEQEGAQATADVFWTPLRHSFSALQRREDVFLAGENFIDDGATTWVMSMGNLMGLFDNDWLGIPATGKLAFLRYAEFHRVDGDKVAESALFCDVLSIMHQAGCYPLPPQTGAHIIQPGPRTQDGILLDAHPPEEGAKTLALVNRMIEDLAVLNRTDAPDCPTEYLQRCWHDDMAWYGPTGIGATYTIPRYQQQHQYPFRSGLTNKVFNGHVARIAEGNYMGFFGWSNLTNTPTGGFMGLPGNDTRADMRVVDVYRRDGDKLAENWIFIDLLHWLSMQGLDVLERLRQQRRLDES